MNRNDKNKKFTPLNINNVFKGKSVEPQSKPSYKVGGMQTLGKVSSMRRVPPPKWVPSLKAETGVSDGRQIINQSSSGWVNPVTSQDNIDSNSVKSQGITSKIVSDKSQWNSKLTTNKPFFLIGQEFPSLQSDSGPENSQDVSKEKSKDTEIKSKIDELRNRDANISVSTLNRIDALSISKSSKGDIAATGWAAEDEEPNFDEKIVFSDEDSSNEVHNWHSDNEEGTKSERIEKRESIDVPPIISDVWHDQNTMRYSQYQQMPIPVNVQGQFINPQFPTNIISRNPPCTLGNIGDEQSAFMNSVAEQRNARNMEYYYAIERARQKKLATQSSRGSCGINEDHNQIDPSLMRSRHTSMTSDTNESMNTPIEMGPPGGPPMMHHLHKPHLQPQISPMIHPHNISVISPSIPPSSMYRITSHPFNIMPMSTVPMEQVDTKLMEKFVEFLKLQSTSEGNPESPMNSSVAGEQAQNIRFHESDMKTISDSNTQQQQDIERPQSHVSSLGSHVQVDKDNVNIDKFTGPSIKDNSESFEKDFQRKQKFNYSQEEDNQKYDQSKKGLKNKNFKEYRPNKTGYKGDYSSNVGGSGNIVERDYYPENNDVTAYEDYNTYKQHYSRDYKVSRGYNRNPSFNYYSDQYSSQSRDNYNNDYHYKSNSLKTKSSTSKSKDSKPSGSNTDHIQSDRETSSSKKYDNQEAWPHENDMIDGSDKRNKDQKKNPKTAKSIPYQPKKIDNRHYKEKPSESTQEYSMGFAVNPKDNRKNYYSSNYTRRYYTTDYNYYNSSSKYNEYDNDNSYYQDNYYPQEYYGYDKDYSSSKYPNKRNPKTSNIGDQWRQIKDEKSNNPRNTETTNSNPSQSKNVNRNNRKSDKRQFSTSKDNENDQEEWETASEGGSVRSNSAPREMHKLHNRQNNSQLNSTENKVISNSNSENRKVVMNKNGSNYSCNGGNSFNDNNGNQDGSGGASGSSGGTRFRSSASQNKSVDSSQNKNIDKTSNENRNSDSTSKNCSNNNNSNKDNLFNCIESRQTDSSQRSSDNAHISSQINLDKYGDFIDDEDMLFENAQFQEVLSKATKKSRKLEEQKRLKEEFRLEQKRLEALKNKNKSDNNQIRKPSSRREQPPRTNKSETNAGHKFENKAAVNIRDKETSNNALKKWEINKVAMQIGSWDNSLADEISSERKAPPKPIGTPASIPAWNKKAKVPFETNPSNVCQNSLSGEPIKMPTDIETISQTFSSENSEVNFNPTSYNSYNNSIYNQPVRTSEESKIETSIESQSAEITIHENINFEYDVKNINCDKTHRNLLSTDRNLQNNDQKLLNDKINSVKTIWDNLPVSNITPESKATIASPINPDVDIHTGPVSINQDVTNTRNIDNNLSSSPVPIPNVCKVKPQLQQDFKKDHNEIILSSQAIQIRNSPAAFLSQNQGGFLPYHRFTEFLPESLHHQEAYTSMISNNQQGMHINYNLPNTHLIDSSLLRQNTQEQILSNKMNFINQSQSSFYPQQTTTPKLMSNTPGQLPINMDIGSAHAPAHHMQQLLLTRQNSLTSSMMQPNPMTIPFIQSGQQPIQAQTPLFPTTPILGATNFSSQINPFSQGHLQPHYPHGNFPSLHHTPQFQPNHQHMLLNQHQHQQQQQLIQGQLSHDRVISSGQSGVFNSVIGPSDISANTGLPDFNGQPKPLNHNNIMHGMSGSAFVLPHNLNILMKPSMFATNSQYNTFTTPIQSNLLNLKNGYDHNTNIKSLDLDHYRHDNPMNDRNIYCGDNAQLQKSNDEYYQDVPEFDNCDINYENWMPNLRYSKVDIYTANNLMPTFDFHSQKSPMQFSPMEPGGDAATYRNFITPFRDNHTSLAAAGLPTNANLQYIISPRLKSQYNQDQSAMIGRQHSKCYENQNYISSNNFNSKNESIDNKILIKCTPSCGGGSNSINEIKDNSKDISNTEKSITESKKNSKQRTSYSDNFDDKNQSWSLIEDDRSVPPEDNKSSIKSSNTENSSHSPNKHFSNSSRPNNFDNQCQYGYDETQLSSQTAESLRKFDQDQLKKVIMKLREGPVMTDTNCNEFDFAPYKGATIPRLMPLQSSSSSRSKPNKYNNSFSSDIYTNSDSNNVGLGFYSRNRALTPPAAQFRTYKNKTNNNNNNSNNRHVNPSLLPNSNNNANINNNRVSSRQKCDTNNADMVVVVVDSDDLKLNSVQSKSLECDNLVHENIIDNSIL